MMEEIPPLDIALAIDLLPSPSFSSFSGARDRGYARLAQLFGISEEPPRFIDEVTDPTSTVFAPSDRKDATDSASPSLPSVGSRPRHRASPSSHAAWPLTEKEGNVALGEDCNGQYLIVLGCSGSPDFWMDKPHERMRHEWPWMRLMLDTGSWALWTYWDKFALLDSSATKHRHVYDPWQSQCGYRFFNPARYFEDEYMTPGSKYRYVPVRAPFSISCGSQEDPELRTIDIPSLDYRLAVAVPPRLDQHLDIDGILGMRADPYRPADGDQHRPTERSARRTLMNQLRDHGMLNSSAKTFVISPAHKKLDGYTPRLWIGVWKWPRSIHPVLSKAYGFDDKKEVVIPTMSRESTSRSREWAVSLREISAYDQVSGFRHILFETEAPGVYASLDTGTELAFLPDEFFSNIVNNSPLHARCIQVPIRNGGTEDHYVFSKDKVRDERWLQLGFGMADGGIKRILVAPLAEAMSYRDSQYKGKHNVAACPSSQLRASGNVHIIGLNWLKHLWTSFRDWPNAAPEVALIPGHTT